MNYKDNPFYIFGEGLVAGVIAVSAIMGYFISENYTSNKSLKDKTVISTSDYIRLIKDNQNSESKQKIKSGDLLYPPRKERIIDLVTEYKTTVQFPIIEIHEKGRNFIALTPPQIWADISSTSDLKEEENFQNYYLEKWLQIKGPVRVSGTLEKPIIYFDFDLEKIGGLVEVEIDPVHAQNFSHISDGTVLTINGKISGRLGKLKLFLKNGELAPVKLKR